MTSGIAKLMDRNGNEITRRRYTDRTNRRKIPPIWQKRYGEKFNEFCIHYVPDFEDEMFDDSGNRITKATYRTEYIREHYGGSVVEMAKQLRTTEACVYGILKKIGFKTIHRNTKITKEQIDFIRNNNTTLKPKAIAEETRLPLGMVYYYLRVIRSPDIYEKPKPTKKEEDKRPPAIYSNNKHLSLYE